MSVIITGMNMPKGCNGTCPCEDGETGFCNAGYLIYGDYKHISEDYDNRPQSCPLKSVEGLIEKITRKANSGQWSEAAVYGMQKAIAIIKEYCEVKG